MKPETAVFAFALAAVTAHAGLAQQETGLFFDAIRSGDTSLVQQLVHADRELLSARDRRQWNEPTPVHAAMSPRREAVLDALLALGADPNAKNGKGEPAMLALRSQSPAKARKLIDAGGDVNASDASGLTLLHYAVADRRSHELARFLIDNGANVNVHSHLGVTPSHVGVSQGAAAFLNPAGARPEFSDWRGRSADYWARSADQLDSLQTPGRGPADISGWTLLHEFAWQGNLECVTWCLEQEQLNHVNATDDEGATPMHAAARFGFGRIADALVAARADPTRRDLRGWTPTDIAAARGYPELAERLRQVASQGVEYGGERPSRCRETTSDDSTWVVKPGRLIADPPTLRCLGFRWWIQGDANRNATCRIEFRQVGSGSWREFYPALRIGGETSGMGWTNPHMFAGSVIDLEPETTYEIRLILSDPDGNVEIQRRLRQATRSEPEPLGDARQIHVGGEQPDFDTVQAAYDAAEPGDVIVVHQGVHHGDLVMNKAATVDKPIVIRGQPGAILRGVGNDLVNVDGARQHIFEDLTFTDADHAFLARGETHALTVRRCRFRQIKKCFFAISQRNRGFLIYDNDMDGPVQDWHPRRTEKSQGVWIAGQGHAVFHNRVRGYWDGLSIKGQATDDPELQNCAIDFYNNDLSEFLDDAIELDYGMHNLRVMRNRIRNTFMGISTQPVEGGPAYIFRNVVYACSRHPLKLNQMPSGLLIFHNTFVADGQAGAVSAGFQNSRIYNNLFLGKRSDYLLSGGTTTPTSDLDFNGYRVHKPKNPDAKWRIHWLRIHPGFSPSGGGLNEALSARSLDDFARLTHQRFERHGGWPIDWGDFVNSPEPDVEADQHDARPIDLRLQADAIAIDKGKHLPGFNGESPDLGAHEFGESLPIYGPRQTMP